LVVIVVLVYCLVYVFTDPSHRDFDVALFLTHSVHRLLAVGACLCVSCVGRSLCVSGALCVGALCVGQSLVGPSPPVSGSRHLGIRMRDGSRTCARSHGFCGCFAVFCVLRVFFFKTVLCGVFVLRVFCDFLDMFCKKNCGNFLSETKMHSSVLRCILCTKHKAYFVRFVRFVYCLVYFVLFCVYVKSAKNTHTKHRKPPHKHRRTPQNTVFFKTSTILLRDPLRVCDTPRNLRV